MLVLNHNKRSKMICISYLSKILISVPDLLQTADANSKCTISSITFFSVRALYSLFLCSFTGNKEGIHCSLYSSEYICIMLRIIWVWSIKNESHKDVNILRKSWINSMLCPWPPPLWLSDGLHIFTFIYFCFLLWVCRRVGGREGVLWSVRVFKTNVKLSACLLCVYAVLSSSINTSNSPLKKIRCIVLCHKTKDKFKRNLCGLCF